MAGAHVVMFPCPLQGHVRPMLKLAELLALHHLHVTFLNTQSSHNRLTRYGDIQSLSACYPTLHFNTIADCYSHGNHPGSGDTTMGDIILSTTLHAKPLLRNILLAHTPEIPKVTSIIQDGIFGSLSNDLASELGIRITILHFRTSSPCCFWPYFWLPNLFKTNELPIRGDEDMDRIISNMPGMENLLRCRDLPSFCRPGTKGNLSIDWVSFQTKQSLLADALILNTFEELDRLVLSQIRLHFPKVYTLGPLHHHLNVRKAETNEANDTPSIRNSFFEEDKSCMAWLDAQAQGSVLYVSFGSSTVVTRQELMEFWHGLVNSKKRFLWVMRPDLVVGRENGDRIPEELEEGTKERGFMVEWAPQEEVLAHKAIGGFLTHSGWNSTLESLVAGVPMICWPYFADQQVNSRFVSDVWKVGLDMKDVCDRDVVEKMVNDIMVHRRDEFLKSAQAMAVLAHQSVSPGGSSHSSMQELIHYIKSVSKENN
ncbi:cytokinin-N-glucosyltransferase [Vigna unguiculata]|uniref:Glycosyltransferase n=1 Tax=Vigna unguiculata TaxID=3917 RepID=A0A4D6LQC3_VIGUN|nr:cytokinin-N-glucosyltransferase [Vigna unguiculata]